MTRNKGADINAGQPTYLSQEAQVGGRTIFTWAYWLLPGEFLHYALAVNRLCALSKPSSILLSKHRANVWQALIFHIPYSLTVLLPGQAIKHPMSPDQRPVSGCVFCPAFTPPPPPPCWQLPATHHLSESWAIHLHSNIFALLSLFLIVIKYSHHLILFLILMNKFTNIKESMT